MPRFREIVGQTHIKQHLMRAARTGQVSHAYLFSGEMLSGKTFIASVFAQALVCERLSAEGEPCCVCPACKKVAEQAHTDVRMVVHEKEGSVRVEEVIEQIVDDAYLTPYDAARKIYIMPDAEKMTIAAQNKLLKTLEEPPSYVTIMLLATSMQALLPTIKSRCMPFQLHPVDHATLGHFLKQTLGVSDYKASLAAHISRGNTGRALRYAGDNRFETRARMTMQMMESLPDETITDAGNRIKEITAQADAEQEALEEMRHIIFCLLRDIGIYKATEKKENLILEEEWEYIRDTAARISYRDLRRTQEALQETRQRIRANVNAQYAWEMFLLTARDRLGHA